MLKPHKVFFIFFHKPHKVPVIVSPDGFGILAHLSPQQTTCESDNSKTIVEKCPETLLVLSDSCCDLKWSINS